MAKKEIKYETAMARIEEIVSSFERNELTLDELSPKLKEAKTLLSLCKKQLIKTEKEVNELLNDGEE